MIDVIRALRTSLYQHPGGRWLVDRVSKRILSRPRRIMFGPGAGLIFDGSGGGLPGQVLGTTDIEEQRLLASILKPGAVFYDIGANIGFYAIIGSRLVGAQGRVFAFEPMTASLAMLRHNLALNSLQNVTICEKAASDENKELQFAFDAETSQHSTVSASSTQQVTAVAIRIDSLLGDRTSAASHDRRRGA